MGCAGVKPETAAFLIFGRTAGSDEKTSVSSQKAMRSWTLAWCLGQLSNALALPTSWGRSALQLAAKSLSPALVAWAKASLSMYSRCSLRLLALGLAPSSLVLFESAIRNLPSAFLRLCDRVKLSMIQFLHFCTNGGTVRSKA